MSVGASARWIVTYDIADKKRLPQVFKFLKRQGVPLQYSVFLVDASSAKIGSIMAHIARLIDKDADDVRAYRIPANPWKVSLGSAILPEGIVSGDGANL